MRKGKNLLFKSAPQAMLGGCKTLLPFILH